MPGPEWSEDAPHDTGLIVSNSGTLLAELLSDASQRENPTAETVKAWHARLYAGCSVPVPAYIGNFRGDPVDPRLIGYEVGVGPLQPDGYPLGVGVWSDQVQAQTDKFFAALLQAIETLDARFDPGVRLTSPADLAEIAGLAAVVHGEWVRLHPFVNGNGRTARVWTAFVAFRYGLPAFVQLKPRPDGVLYSRAAAKSMGRPPDFVGDHAETIAVFAHWLRLHSWA